MRFGKKLAIIAQLALLNGVWLFNIAVYQKYNYFSEARHLSYLPADASVCVSVKTSDLAGKVFHEFLYNQKTFNALFPARKMDELAGRNPFEMGLDPNDQVSLYLSNRKSDGFAHAGYFMDLLDRNVFTASLVKKRWKKIASEGSLEIFSLNGEAFAACNDEVALQVAFSRKMKHDEVKKVICGIFDSAAENNPVRTDILSKLKEGSDLVIACYARNEMIHSPLLNHFIITGEIKDDRIVLASELHFNQDVSHVFPAHAVNEKFSPDDIPGFFALQGNFDLPNADMVPENLGLVSFSDSLSLLLKKTLHKRQCSRMRFVADGWKKVKFAKRDDYPEAINFAIGLNKIMLPEFSFMMNCVESAKVDSLMNVISRNDTFLHASANGFYRYSHSNYDLFIKAVDGVFSVQTRPEMALSSFPETGYSNFVYLDYNKMRESIPDLMARTMATSLDLFKHVFMYSTRCQGMVLYGKGELVIEEGSPAILELMRFDEKLKEWSLIQRMFMRTSGNDDEDS